MTAALPRLQVKSAVAAAGGKLELWWGPTMYHLDDLPFRCVGCCEFQVLACFA